jgi:hypothetical protein
MCSAGLILLALASCNSAPGIGRFSKLEIVDKSGEVRAMISVTDDETQLTVHGSRKVDGVKFKVSPTFEVSMGINSGRIKHTDESGSIFIDTRSIILSDPDGVRRVEIEKPLPSDAATTDNPTMIFRDRSGKVIDR